MKERKTMDEQTKELIAIGASIGAHCQSCLTYHVSRAKEIGVDAGQIRAAMEVGQMVEKGSMSAMREFAKGVLGTAPRTEVQSCCPDGAKGCCG
ncbi:MAG: carboxymuconolactone decarboxylase family protein [Kiritimatiellae bacterium]|nr:carboxymuconolactone decarboxylase family protein [Kiritimatiellia bacterium]MDD5519547.1 carboxymuconolactone decarboxylase family protein [Kiritimatiellia bacterium]